MSAASLDRPLLAKILGMLGSSEDGEVLAAARQAVNMMKASGQDWNTVLQPKPEGNSAYSARQVAQQGIVSTVGVLYPPYGLTWRESVRWLIGRGAGRTEWERWMLDRLAVRLASGSDHRRPHISPAWAADVVRIAHEVDQEGAAA